MLQVVLVKRQEIQHNLGKNILKVIFNRIDANTDSKYFCNGNFIIKGKNFEYKFIKQFKFDPKY